MVSQNSIKSSTFRFLHHFDYGQLRRQSGLNVHIYSNIGISNGNIKKFKISAAYLTCIATIIIIFTNLDTKNTKNDQYYYAFAHKSIIILAATFQKLLYTGHTKIYIQGNKMANSSQKRSELRFERETEALRKNLEKRKKQQAELDKRKSEKVKNDGQTEN